MHTQPATSAPDISVLMPVFQGERHIAGALASIRCSRFEGAPLSFEVVVVDAGSTDATAEIVEAVAAVDGRVRLVRSSERLAAPRARNVGLAEVRAPFVACLDHDDETLPGRLGLHHRILTDDPTLAAVGGGLDVVDAVGVGKNRAPGPRRPSRSLGPLASRYQLLASCPTLTSAMTYRVATLRSVGGFDEHARYADDYHLFWKLTDHGGIRIVDEPAARYRQHASQLSTAQRPQQQLEVLMLRQRIAADVLGEPPPLPVVWAWRYPATADAETLGLATRLLDDYHRRFVARFEPTGTDLDEVERLHRQLRATLTDPTDLA